MKMADRIKPYVSLIETEQISMKQLSKDLGISCFAVSHEYRNFIFDRDYGILYNSLVSKGKKRMKINALVFVKYSRQFRKMEAEGKIGIDEILTEDGKIIVVEMKEE